MEQKIHEEILQSYLSDSEFITYLNRNGILIKRTDNLTRFCKNNDISWIKVKREGSAGATPHYYNKVSTTKLQKIRENLRNNNNSLLGRQVLKEKEKEVLKIFDKAEARTVNRTSISEIVSKNLKVKCNRKFVKKVLDARRKSQLEKKLTKIS